MQNISTGMTQVANRNASAVQKSREESEFNVNVKMSLTSKCMQSISMRALDKLNMQFSDCQVILATNDKELMASTHKN